MKQDSQEQRERRIWANEIQAKRRAKFARIKMNLRLNQENRRRNTIDGNPTFKPVLP